MKCIVCRKTPVFAPHDTCQECRKRIHRSERVEAMSWDFERDEERRRRKRAW